MKTLNVLKKGKIALQKYYFCVIRSILKYIFIYEYFLQKHRGAFKKFNVSSSQNTLIDSSVVYNMMLKIYMCNGIVNKAS